MNVFLFLKESLLDFYFREFIFRMLVNIFIVGKGVDLNIVDIYDSGDDWEIGVGNLIIDLDVDLEKDRQKFEMNNFINIISNSNFKDCGGLVFSGVGVIVVLVDGLKFVFVQVFVFQGNLYKEISKLKVKRSKIFKDVNKFLFFVVLYGIFEISSIGKRQEV